MMNKLFKPFVALLVASSLVLAGCAGTSSKNVQTAIGSPDQVQLDVKALGSVAYGHITSSSVKSAVHQFATRLMAVTEADFSSFVGYIPKTGNMNADALIAAGVAYVQAAAGKFGQHNPTTIAYARAVGNGLLAAGF